MPKRSSKHPLSLIEVVIALSLTAILLTSLFSSYRNLVVGKAKIEKVRSQLHPKWLTSIRLQQIFDNLEEGNYFYTEEGVLSFRFDNGLEPKPKYCGPINGTLQCKNGSLVLTLIERTEILQRGVKELSFAFFDPKKKKWVKEWRGSTLPTLVKICINQENYCYNIPNVKHEVEY